MAVYNPQAVPSGLTGRGNLKTHKTPAGFLRSEKFLSDITRHNLGLFLSPYPKLPLFGSHCPSIHTIHDVLDLTHPAYSKRIKTFFDSYRLRSALKKADLTWYVSECSLKDTRLFIGSIGKAPKVRHNGIDGRFAAEGRSEDDGILKSYGLKQGYILVIGNGRPHKNLGVLLEISHRLERLIVFAGVSGARQKYWKTHFPQNRARWIEHVTDQDLPAILRGAFCLAQPSTAEGYGYPPLEAMACGIPAVVSDIPVLIETTGRNALFADPGNPSEWIEAFLKLEKRTYYEEKRNLSFQWAERLRGPSGWNGHIEDIENILRMNETMDSGKAVCR